MDWSAHCAVVVPCLNEANVIASLVRQARTHLPTVLVVDDGSSDATAEEAASAGAVVLRHDASLGKGAALSTGWKRAASLGFSWAMTLDGDGQHAPSDLPAFFARADGTQARLIIGNRMGQAVEMPWVRRFVNRWVSRRLSMLAGVELPDALCGFRLVHLPSWERLGHVSQRFEVESEVLLKFVQAGLGVEFVPVHVIYRAERSKIQPWRDTLRWFRWYRGQRRGGGPGRKEQRWGRRAG